MLVFTQIQGVSGVGSISLMVPSSKGGYEKVPVDKYDGTEALSCVIWPGDDRAQTATLTATWNDPTLGDIDIAFPAELTSSLEATWYSGLLTLASDSTGLAVFRLEVDAGPGTAIAPKTYHSYKDLVDEFPSVGKLASQLNDQSGFAEVAAEARRWIDADILRKAPIPCWGQYGYRSGQGYGGWDRNGVYGLLDQPEDPCIRAALDADQLTITTATGRRFVDASIYYTLGKILRRAVGTSTTNDLLALADYYEDKAEKKLRSCVAEIDTNADGCPEYVFPLSRTRLRRS